MVDAIHLERMGRELKCPICLSLLNSAVTTPCGHLFCRSCITMSMKSGPNCPVCKVPCQPRELRAASQVDNLVSIYKSMEVDLGISIFVTQNDPPAKLLGEEKCQDVAIGDEQGISTTKKSCRSAKPNLMGSTSAELSFPTKKRVQVPQKTLSETPNRNAKCGKELDTNVNNMSKDRSLTPKKVLDGMGESPILPFSWLRDEDGENSSLHSDDDLPLDFTPPHIPSFSDIKDSDDDSPSSSSATSSSTSDGREEKMQVRSNSTAANLIPEQLTSRKIKTNDQMVPGSRLKRQKHESDEINGEVPPVPEQTNEDATHQACFPSPEALVTGRPLSSANKKSGGGEAFKTRNARTCRKIKANDQLVPGSRLKIRHKPESNQVNGELPPILGPKKGAMNQACLPSPQDNDKKESTSKRYSKHGEKTRLATSLECHRGKKSKKNVSSGDSSKDAIQESNTTASARPIHFTEKSKGSPHVSLSSRFLTPERLTLSNRVTLRKCTSVTSKIHCAFCLSSEDTEDSGEMIHYYKGKPVSADYNGGSNIIHSHRSCTEWAPNIFFEDDIAINLESELARSRRIKCCLCELKGAALGCYEKSCRKSFHIPCAKLIPQCCWDDENFVMLCPLHVSSKLPNQNSGSQKKKKEKCIKKLKIGSRLISVADKKDMTANRNRKSYKGSQKMVLCCSALTVAEKVIVSEFKKLSGASVLKKWNPSVTHVIASVDENKACKRTLKILMGILEGKWILNIDWVKACMNAMEPIDEEQYEITVDIHGIRDGPRVGRLRVSNKQLGIFCGLKLYIVGEFVPSYKAYLQDLVVAGGGTILHRKPIPGQIFDSSTSAIVIVYNLELPNRCNAAGKRNTIIRKRQLEAETLAISTGAKAVSSLWVLNSIAASTLQAFSEGDSCSQSTSS